MSHEFLTSRNEFYEREKLIYRFKSQNSTFIETFFFDFRFSFGVEWGVGGSFLQGAKFIPWPIYKGTVLQADGYYSGSVH